MRLQTEYGRSYTLQPWRAIIACTVLLGVMLISFPAFSQGRTRVRGYFRKNGTYVAPHWRTLPDGVKSNNYSYPGNYNPNTGKVTPSPGDDVWVSGYYRSDGTYVSGHYRKSPLSRGGLPEPGPSVVSGRTEQHGGSEPNEHEASSIQERLKHLGYYTMSIDGIWGNGSRRALRAFKVRNGLPDDDEWDLQTKNKLFSLDAVFARVNIGPQTPPAEASNQVRNISTIAPEDRVGDSASSDQHNTSVIDIDVETSKQRKNDISRAEYWKARGYTFDPNTTTAFWMDQKVKDIERAAYWKSRGYTFDPNTTTAFWMDQKVEDIERAKYWKVHGYTFDPNTTSAFWMDQKVEDIERAKYWKARGYTFDPNTTSAFSMDQRVREIEKATK